VSETISSTQSRRRSDTVTWITSAGRDLTALRSKAGCDRFQRGLVPPDRTTRAFRAAGSVAIAAR
jgi:hypothetical protein